MMHARSAPSSWTAAALCAVAGLASSGCRGIDADVTYPSELPSLDNQLQTPEGDGDPSVTLGAFKFAPSVCQGIDVHAQTAALTAEDLVRFLDKQGVKITPVQARPDLYWFDVPNGQENNGKLRLRLAILPSPALPRKISTTRCWITGRDGGACDGRTSRSSCRRPGSVRPRRSR